jgi:Ca2+-binding RTX toxin-like protein
MDNLTVAGPHGVITLHIDTGANLQLAQQIAAAISAGVYGHTLTPETSRDGPPPRLPHGTEGEFVQQTPDQKTYLPKGYDAVVNATHNATIFGSGGPSESVLSGIGGFTFVAHSGSGTVVAGGGKNRIEIQPRHTGDWYISTGPGNDSISALGRGNDTIQPGPGHNSILLGSGDDLVQLSGTDSITASGGQATIDASQAKSTLMVGGSSSINFVGGSGTVTLFGGSGSDTFQGGSGKSVVHGGTGGDNTLYGGTGQASLFGGGRGDMLFAQGSMGQELRAGRGNETLSAVQSSGNVTLVGGPGKDHLLGGSGDDSFVAGHGSATMTAGSGSDTFTFISSHASGHDLIKDFSSLDKIDLRGYGPDAVQNALASQTSSNDSVTITLNDHTKITFTGITSLHPDNFT